MARKKKAEEPENSERWLVSYADFITLLFAFFVVMYSVSSVNEGKYRVLSDSLIAAFRSSNKSLSPIQIGVLARSPATQDPEFLKMSGAIKSPPMPSQEMRKGRGIVVTGHGSGSGAGAMDQIAKAIEKSMAKLVAQNLISVRRTDLYLEIEIRASILFISSSSQLSDEARPILQDMASILKSFPNPIRVEGYTDNIPINTVFFPSNWELSAARAASVVHLLSDSGVMPYRMGAIGYGEFRPIAPNNTALGRNKNRRVSIIIMAYSGAEKMIDVMGEEERAARVEGMARAGIPVDITDMETTTQVEPGFNFIQPVSPMIAPPIRLLYPFHQEDAAAGEEDQ